LTAPTKEGFTFDGWYKDADCTQVWDFDIDTVSEDTILFAKWKEVVYSVILNTQSGSDVDAISINENGTIDQSSLNVPTKEGFSFAGWYKDANCTQVWNFDTDTVSEDTTLFAKWSEESQNPTQKPTQNPTQEPTTPVINENKGMSGGDIAGMIIGILLALVLGAYIVLFILWKKGKTILPFLNKAFEKTVIILDKVQKALKKAIKFIAEKSKMIIEKIKKFISEKMNKNTVKEEVKADTIATTETVATADTVATTEENKPEVATEKKPVAKTTAKKPVAKTTVKKDDSTK